LRSQLLLQVLVMTRIMANDRDIQRIALVAGSGMGELS